MEIIQNNDWNLSVDLNGGRIKELKYKNEIVLGTYERIDGKTGNTHICCPNFGNEGVDKFNLPFHGPFRNLEWGLINKNQNQIVIETQNLGLKIKQSFEINNGFKQIIRVENLEDNERIINLAIHNYWDAKNGWQGTKLSGEIVDGLITSDSSKTISSVNVLEIPGKFKYRWNLSGFRYGQFWTSFVSSNKNKEYDQSYICIEPSLEKQGFLLESKKNNLPACGFLEFIQSIEVLEK